MFLKWKICTNWSISMFILLFLIEEILNSGVHLSLEVQSSYKDKSSPFDSKIPSFEKDEILSIYFKNSFNRNQTCFSIFRLTKKNYFILALYFKDCQKLLVSFLAFLKRCNYRTDAIKLIIRGPAARLPNAEVETLICDHCLLSNNGALFRQRGVIGLDLSGTFQEYCRVGDSWIINDAVEHRTGTNISGTKGELSFVNPFTKRNWGDLQKFVEIYENPKITLFESPIEESVDLQDFGVVAICKKLLNRACTGQIDSKALKEYYQTGDWKKMVELLEDNKIHIATNVLPYYNASWELEFTPAVYFDHLSFAILKVDQVDQNQITIEYSLKPFSKEVWLTIILTVLITTVFLFSASLSRSLLTFPTVEPLHVIKRGRIYRMRRDIFTFGAVIVEQTQQMKWDFERKLLFGTWSLVCLIIVANYRSKLFGFLVNKVEGEYPKDFPQLFESEYKFGSYVQGFLNFWAKISNHSTLDNMTNSKNLYYNDSVSASKCFQFSLTSKFACIGFNMFSRINAEKQKVAIGIKRSVDDLYYFSKKETEVIGTWALRKGSPFTPNITKALGRLSQGGLFTKWKSFLLRRALTNGRLYHKAPDQNVTSLENRTFSADKLAAKMSQFGFKADESMILSRHIFPVFEGLLLGLAVCWFTFFLEYIYYYLHSLSLRKFFFYQ